MEIVEKNGNGSKIMEIVKKKEWKWREINRNCMKRMKMTRNSGNRMKRIEMARK